MRGSSRCFDPRSFERTATELIALKQASATHKTLQSSQGRERGREREGGGGGGGGREREREGLDFCSRYLFV